MSSTPTTCESIRVAFRTVTASKTVTKTAIISLNHKPLTNASSDQSNVLRISGYKAMSISLGKGVHAGMPIPFDIP